MGRPRFCCCLPPGLSNTHRARSISAGSQGYLVRGTTVTHLADLDAAAAASIGAIKVIRQGAVAALWTRVNDLLGAYSADGQPTRPRLGCWRPIT